MTGRIQGQTGHSSDADRRAEMERMATRLADEMQNLSKWEQQFVIDMACNLESEEWVPTPAQLFKMRDINAEH